MKKIASKRFIAITFLGNSQIDFSKAPAFYELLTKGYGWSFDSNIELLVYPNRDENGWAWSNPICLQVAVKCREQLTVRKKCFYRKNRRLYEGIQARLLCPTHLFLFTSKRLITQWGYRFVAGTEFLTLTDIK